MGVDENKFGTVNIQQAFEGQKNGTHPPKSTLGFHPQTNEIYIQWLVLLQQPTCRAIALSHATESVSQCGRYFCRPHVAGSTAEQPRYRWLDKAAKLDYKLAMPCKDKRLQMFANVTKVSIKLRNSAFPPHHAVAVAAPPCVLVRPTWIWMCGLCFAFVVSWWSLAWQDRKGKRTMRTKMHLTCSQGRTSSFHETISSHFSSHIL